jgi:hypothetical protein
MTRALKGRVGCSALSPKGNGHTGAGSRLQRRRGEWSGPAVDWARRPAHDRVTVMRNRAANWNRQGVQNCGEILPGQWVTSRLDFECGRPQAALPRRPRRLHRHELVEVPGLDGRHLHPVAVRDAAQVLTYEVRFYLPEGVADTSPAVGGDFSFYQFPTDAFWAKLFASAPASLKSGIKVQRHQRKCHARSGRLGSSAVS